MNYSLVNGSIQLSLNQATSEILNRERIEIDQIILSVAKDLRNIAINYSKKTCLLDSLNNLTAKISEGFGPINMPSDYTGYNH